MVVSCQTPNGRQRVVFGSVASPATELPSDPLGDGDPRTWDRLISACGPASILVVIESWLGAGLRRTVTADDVWQETLLHAWRDRAQCEWRGVAEFRAWLLQVARNRMLDLAKHESAEKRGARAAHVSLSGTRCEFAGPVASTTPSRVAVVSEQARLIRQAIDSLPDDVRDVVFLRLLEGLKIHEVAERLGLGVEGTRHRLRKGAELYQARLQRLLADSEWPEAPGAPS